MNVRPEPSTLLADLPLAAARRRVMQRRRLTMLALNLATLAFVALCATQLAAQNGWRAVDLVLLACVLVATPWNAIGFWNASVGLFLLHARRDGVMQAAPFLGRGRDAHVSTRTAILMTLRNEDPERALSRLRAVKAGLDATGFGGQFDYFLLSDTNREDVARAEEAAVARWRAEAGSGRIVYRRRPVNSGFKAGNVRDFCLTWGGGYDFMLPLDADSLMGAPAVLDLVRILEANPRIGILQSLVVGLPSASGFARLFQFGMRHGMRCYTLGATWWAGDCGPFWGHNALIRVQPFTLHCELPLLPGEPPLGGPILSHDQVEAVLMRRAGYEVRVVPVEGESFEENPPTVLDFMARDLRWCLGNLQYTRLLSLPGLLPMSRFQLVWAILMFAAMPAVPLALLLLPFAAMDASPAVGAGAAGLYLGLLFMSLSPKLAGLLDVALSAGGAARYGGAGRFTLSALAELAFAFLLAPIMALSTTRFLALLAFGHVHGVWNGQARDAHALSWHVAARALWLPTVFGLAVALAMALIAPVLLLWTAPLIAGCWLAIPFAVFTADPRFGAWLAARGLCATPEEAAPPAIFSALAPPAAAPRRVAA
ncbi:glucans biosynthesis glucosyltransferase MdoH [Roseixanthobacter pseudopolyaromaticivorans]|uniref:glucans biosynthesis glucosyltransferase MdoH n=1 Tax=Xanthobacteraceae TaxID=335928 RepID=UPI00372CA332